MPVENDFITHKKYKKLSVQVSLTGLSYCCFDTLNNQITKYNEIIFDTADKSKSIEVHYKNALSNNATLSDVYDEITVLHYNNLATFVPSALFDENHLGAYLQYNTKVFETDFFAFDELENYQMNLVYIPYTNINNLLLEHFGNFKFKHANSILIAKLLDISKNNEDKKMFVNFNKNQFELCVIQNQKLLFFNSFEYQTPEDFIYYLLFTAEQLRMNPEVFTLELLGNINTEDAFFEMALKYIRNINLFDQNFYPKNNDFSNEINQKLFILFQS
jgi:Protein of unknown function (DUF3822)